MPDTSTMKTKEKSSKLRCGYVNATNRNSCLNIIFAELVTKGQKVKVIRPLYSQRPLRIRQLQR